MPKEVLLRLECLEEEKRSLLRELDEVQLLRGLLPGELLDCLVHVEGLLVADPVVEVLLDPCYLPIETLVIDGMVDFGECLNGFERQVGQSMPDATLDHSLDVAALPLEDEGSVGGLLLEGEHVLVGLLIEGLEQ